MKWIGLDFGHTDSYIFMFAVFIARFRSLLFEFHTIRTKPGAPAQISTGSLLRISALEA